MLDDSKSRDPEITSIAQMQTNDSGYREHMRDVLSISNENFFPLAAEKLASILGVRYVFITECCDEPTTRVRTLAFWNNDRIIGNINYPLDHTPCEKVLEGNTCYYPDNIQQHFPEDHDLVDLNVSGYIATPMFGDADIIVGHIVAMDTKPIDIDQTKISVLKGFAIRAGREVERAGIESMVDALTSGYHLPLGGDVFSQLTKIIADVLDVDYAIIGKFDGYQDNKIEVLAIFHRGELLDPMTYSLDNSPCATVVGKQSEAYATGVQRVFPDFTLLKTLGADGYAGTPLFDSVGEPIGLLAVFNQHPLVHTKKIKAVLEIFGVRASLELERSDQEERIRYYDGILSTTDDLMAFVDKNYIYKAVSRSYSTVFGKPINEIVGKSVLDLHGEGPSYNETKSSLDRSFKGQTMSAEFWRPMADGTDKCILGQHKPFCNAKGEIVGAVIAARDITKLKRVQTDLAKSQQRLQSLYDDTPSTFFTININSIIVSVNDYGAKEYGYEIDQLLGRPFHDLMLAEDQSVVAEQIAKCFAEPDKVFSWELRKLRKSGKEIWAKESARVVINQNGENELFIVSEDMTERHKLTQALSYQATHDSLTDLFNRSEFERQLELLLAAGETGHALCFLDLDQFKIINDACGHLAGDDLLKNIAEFLNRKVSSDDVLARLGGDEFGILMKHCSLEQAAKTANEIRQLIEEYQFIWQNRQYSVGVSIGIVAIDRNNCSLDMIMSRVDAACYMAKDYGRNRVHVYDEYDADIERHRGEMGWVNRIKDAIDNDKFELYSQKIININTPQSSPTSCELLIRLVEGDNVILPGAFLPAAERFDLATKIDKWVVSAAMDWLAMEQQNSQVLSYCSINLSGHSLSDDEFLEFLLQKLSASNIYCHIICFEITETAAVSNLSSAIRFIEQVKAKGCSFALDDFGSGVSSFTYLKNLPVDYVKIDGSFVKDIADDPIDCAMVRSINEIAQLMGKKTIAEFVENDEILAQLRTIGVDYAQGFGIGKPTPLSFGKTGRFES
jgi:diguanylate cyclase (GGDEF)-like protein/PAS domain S-box-containing protein